MNKLKRFIFRFFVLLASLIAAISGRSVDAEMAYGPSPQAMRGEMEEHEQAMANKFKSYLYDGDYIRPVQNVKRMDDKILFSFMDTQLFFCLDKVNNMPSTICDYNAPKVENGSESIKQFLPVKGAIYIINAWAGTQEYIILSKDLVFQKEGNFFRLRIDNKTEVFVDLSDLSNPISFNNADLKKIGLTDIKG
ncbi:MAG: hypothetical protein HQL25_00865 [Candidatus Omnitrophica bacterium]|nr:hypothetical protein [Candidatus Omnitrophota bacterium]